MTARVELKLEGQVDHLRLAWQAGETLLNAVPFEEDPKDTRYNVLLAMQELLTNVLRHGYQGNERFQRVVLTFETTPQTFEFEIRDRAPHFDPTEHLPPETPQSTDDDVPGPQGGAIEQEGGYGILIVKTIMDALHYSRVDGWNVVRAVKFVGAGVTAGAPELQS